MATVSSLSIAYQTAKALADVLGSLALALPLTQAEALQARAVAYRISAILAPRITDVTQVAAIGQAFAEAVPALAVTVAPTDAAPAFVSAAASAALAVPRMSSPAMTRAGALGRMLAACAEAALLGQAFVAEAQSEFMDRQSAIAARARVAAAMDGATDRIAAAAGQDVVGLLTQVANICSSHIATLAADLKPLIQVETVRSAPSSVLAWELYGDPERGAELVARNRSMTPMFMPTKIVALAPGA